MYERYKSWPLCITHTKDRTKDVGVVHKRCIQRRVQMYLNTVLDVKLVSRLKRMYEKRRNGTDLGGLPAAGSANIT